MDRLSTLTPAPSRTSQTRPKVVAVLVALILLIGITASVMAARRTYRVNGLDCLSSEKAKIGAMSHAVVRADPSPEAAVQRFVSSMQPPDFPEGRYVEVVDEERFPHGKQGPSWDRVLVHSTDGRIDAAVMVSGGGGEWAIARFVVCK